MEEKASPCDDSISEFSSEFVGYSETGSLVESVGSAEIECSTRKAKQKQNTQIDRFKSGPAGTSAYKKVGTQFQQFVKEVRGVPVEAVWSFFRDQRALASLVPGIIESFHHLEGEGGTGSLYVANYAPTWVKPGDDKYLINKVEVRDDDSKLYVVRRVGGQYHIWYQVYMIYVQVLPDAILGDKSSVVVWRLESEHRSLHSPPSGLCPTAEGTRKSYMIVTDMIKERYLTMNRVDRPIVVNKAVPVNMTKRLKLRLQARQQLLIGAADDEERELSPEQRRRKSRLLKNDDGSDRESKAKWRPPLTKRKTPKRLVQFQKQIST